MNRDSLVDLLSRWNRATNPAALRTDHEAKRNRDLARALRAQIDRVYVEGRDYKESAHSGRLVEIDRTKAAGS